jgi:hypothetical protein
MICVLALICFGLLGLFSVKYRSYAKEAFSCVFHRITLRRCVTGFDERIKLKIVSRIFKKSTKLAKFTNRHFEAISWIFTIMLFSSFGYSAYSLYNLATLGVCEPGSEECVFVPEVEECVANCEDMCLCAPEICESPAYKACGGDCTCQRGVCGLR